MLQTALKPLLHAALSHCAHARSEPYVPRVAGILESRSTRPGTAVAPTYQRPTPAPSRATAVSRTARLAAPLARQSRESACTLHRSSRLSAMGFFKKSEVKKNYEFGKGRIEYGSGGAGEDSWTPLASSQPDVELLVL